MTNHNKTPFRVTFNPSASPEAVILFETIQAKMRKAIDEWIARLRAHGIKAAHPDDGWVDRKNNIVRFMFPYFNDNLSVGDIFVLGGYDKCRIMYCTSVTMSMFAISEPRYEYGFQEIDVEKLLIK